MQLERNLRIYDFSAEHEEHSPCVSDGVKMVGITVGRTVYQQPLPFGSGLASIIHEAGHWLGKGYSFTKKTVLTVAEAEKCTLQLSTIDRIRLLMVASSQAVISPQNNLLYDTAERILSLYTRQKFKLSDNLKVEMLDEEAITTIARQQRDDGSPYGVYSVSRVLSERDAYVVALSCLKIFENSLKVPVIPNFIPYEIVIGGDGGIVSRLHQSALNMAIYAYENKIILPSEADRKIKAGRAKRY